jgi:hypothetical protein
MTEGLEKILRQYWPTMQNALDREGREAQARKRKERIDKVSKYTQKDVNWYLERLPNKDSIPVFEKYLSTEELKKSKSEKFLEKYENDPTSIYDEKYYKRHLEQYREWEIELGKGVAELFNIKECVDLGCGVGSYMEGMLQGGVNEIVGYEYSYDASIKFTPDEMKPFIQKGDATRPIKFGKKYDLSWSVEVAEHIPTECSDQFVNNLCNASGKYILLTAAPEGQRGTGHINCQPQKFWIEKFEKRGFKHVSRTIMWDLWNMCKRIKGVPSYIRKNLMFFVKDPEKGSIIIKNNKFGTTPNVFHYHGRPSINHKGRALARDLMYTIGYNCEEKFSEIKKKSQTYPVPLNIKQDRLDDRASICLVSNYGRKTIGSYSLDYLGYDYTIIGKDIVNFRHIDKLLSLCKFVKTCETEYIIYMDEIDAFMVGDVSDMIEKFKKFDCQFLFQAEGWFYPKAKDEFGAKVKAYFDKLAPQDTPYKYLNSGAFMFRTEYYRSIMDRLLACEVYVPDVCQARYMNFFMEEFPNIKLDYYCDIFQSLPTTQWFTDHYGELVDMKVEII